jgi:hypothetical protein
VRRRYNPRLILNYVDCSLRALLLAAIKRSLLRRDQCKMDSSGATIISHGRSIDARRPKRLA